MPDSSRKYLIGLALFLAAGALVGWMYGRPGAGFLIASSLALIWQIRQLLFFDRALHTGDFTRFRYGEGIWQQIFSRFSYERERGNRYKQLHRQVIKDVRKSTNAMPDGAVVLDDANEISICNRAAKQLAGLKRKKDRGQRIDNILRDPGLIRLLEDNDPKKTVDIPSPARDELWLNCRVVPFGPDQKLLLMRDVTERMTLNKMRRDFVANASHELRSPLTVMAGYLDAMAEDPELVANWGPPLDQMRNQASRMTRIIAELLELSRLEGAGLASKEEFVDVSGLLASARKCSLSQEESPTIEVVSVSAARLRGSGSEIESVITNLLSNAIRHTAADGKVTLAWHADADGAELVVTDTGEGIAAEHLPRLTERFFRVDRGRAREDGGVGLGLAIVKHVVSRHEGELSVSSERGKGSEFRCLFPASRIVAEPPIALDAGRELSGKIT